MALHEGVSKGGGFLREGGGTSPDSSESIAEAGTHRGVRDEVGEAVAAASTKR